MTEYLIYFNQQWVGDHPEEWYGTRAPLAKAVVLEAEAAGVLVYAGGLGGRRSRRRSAPTPPAGPSSSPTGPSSRPGVPRRPHDRRRAGRGAGAGLGRQDRGGVRLAPGGAALRRGSTPPDRRAPAWCGRGRPTVEERGASEAGASLGTELRFAMRTSVHVTSSPPGHSSGSPATSTSRPRPVVRAAPAAAVRELHRPRGRPDDVTFIDAHSLGMLDEERRRLEGPVERSGSSPPPRPACWWRVVTWPATATPAAGGRPRTTGASARHPPPLRRFPGGPWSSAELETGGAPS